MSNLLSSSLNNTQTIWIYVIWILKKKKGKVTFRTYILKKFNEKHISVNLSNFTIELHYFKRNTFSYRQNETPQEGDSDAPEGHDYSCSCGSQWALSTLLVSEPLLTPHLTWTHTQGRQAQIILEPVRPEQCCKWTNSWLKSQRTLTIHCPVTVLQYNVSTKKGWDAPIR